MIGHFEAVEQASDEELAQTNAMLLFSFVIPIPAEVEADMVRIGNEWDENGKLAPPSRDRLIAIIHNLLAPTTN